MDMGLTSYLELKKRFPVVNGIFYPESPETMITMLVSWGLKADSAASGGQTILAPHGAWDITGNIAAAAFGAVQKKKRKDERRVRRVLLLGAHHHADNEEGIFLSESNFSVPPLGGLPVDGELNRELSSCSTLIRINDIPHLSEHSLEVLLPLVKYCFPDVKIIPILMCGEKPALISGLAKALRIVFESFMDESLIVVSSTASRHPDAAVARSMASEFRSLLESAETSAFLGRLAAGRVTASAGAVLGSLLESGLLGGRRFSSLCPLAQSVGENGDTFCYGAFGA